jgi:hypothetical protein
MVVRAGLPRVLGASLAFVALACGGQSEAEERGAGSGKNGGTGANGGSAGTSTGGADASGGTAGANEPACTPGELRCNADFRREKCSDEGSWGETDFVCARTVAVDDESGSRCVTKGDGSYRCWGNQTSDELPPENYERVQLAGQALIGLTEDGRFLAPSLELPPDVAPAVTFRAALMGSNQAICPLSADGSFSIVRIRHELDAMPSAVVPVDGSFLKAFCVWEGLGAGIRSDGSLWLFGSSWLDPAPTDWRDVAMSVRILCGIKNDGNVVCEPPVYRCGNTGLADCVGDELPAFPDGNYRSITATSAAACVVDEAGALICKRYDGMDMPVDDGRFTFAEGGSEVLCALRTDGTTACFNHGGGPFGFEVEAFAPAVPPVDPDW